MVLFSRAYRLFSTWWPPTFSADNPSSLKRGQLKSFPPQLPVPDNEMIAVIFPDKVIIVAGGKISPPYP
jgi:hypothetical protein